MYYKRYIWYANVGYMWENYMPLWQIMMGLTKFHSCCKGVLWDMSESIHYSDELMEH